MRGADINRREPGLRARRVESGRVWLLVEDGQLVFKADIASDTPDCIYLEGLYVDPLLRGRSYGLRCLAQMGRQLLARTRVLSALVNEENAAAQALFQKAGYRLAATTTRSSCSAKSLKEQSGV